MRANIDCSGYQNLASIIIYHILEMEEISHENQNIPSEKISPHCDKGKVSGQIFTNLLLLNVKCMHLLFFFIGIEKKNTDMLNKTAS